MKEFIFEKMFKRLNINKINVSKIINTQVVTPCTKR